MNEEQDMLRTDTVAHKPADLQQRLVEFAVRVIGVGTALPANKVGAHIASQIVRAGTSPAANYAEAQSAEARADFIHKIKICLKELRETHVWLQIIAAAALIKTASKLALLLDECNQLIAIFVSSINTARRKTGAA